MEERLLPHPVSAEFVGPTLCSIRVQTLIARDCTPQIFAAVLQPGTAGIDHLQHGAVGCWVDLDTGRLGRGRSRGSRADTTVIPGTDRHFRGFQLPEWDAIRHLALEGCGGIPVGRSIGWDIGVSARGPVLIEGNERWSPSLVQMPAPRGLMTGELEAVGRSLRSTRSERA